MTISWNKSGQLVHGSYAMGSFFTMFCDTVGNVYVLGDSTGPFRSTNNGGSWSSIAVVAGHQTESGCVTPNGNIYICTNTTIVYKSIDNGATFTAVTALPSSYAYCMVACNDNSVIVNAGSDFYRSTDGGATWSVASPAGVITSTTRSMFKDSTGKVYICCTSTDGATGYSYSSSDSGVTWTLLSTTIWRCGCSDKNGVLYVGGAGWICKSLDSGATWTVVYNADTTTNFYTCFVDAAGTVWFGSSSGAAVVYSTDSGATWTVTLSTTSFQIYAGCVDLAGYVYFGSCYNSALPTTTGYLYRTSSPVGAAPPTKQLYVYSTSSASWKAVTTAYVGVGSAWKQVTAEYGGVSGVWK